MLKMLIPSLESMKNDNIDVYLQPLVEELEKLWIGVPIVDVTMSVRSQSFSLRAICMWSIHNYLAYGLFVGCQMKVIWLAFCAVQIWKQGNHFY
jgi:hypothetical protein